MKLLTAISLTLWLVASNLALAKPKIVLPTWEKWIEEDGSGFGAEIFFAVAAAGKLELDTTYIPLKRALVMYQKNHFDCFVGGDTKTVYDYIQMTVIESELFLRNIHVVYTLKGTPTFSTLHELDNKRLGIPGGLESATYNFDEINVTLDEVFETRQNIAKLKAGRIDGIINVYPDDKDFVKELHFDPELVLYSSTDRLHCHNTPDNQNVITAFNEGIRHIKSNGFYQKTFEKYYGTPILDSK